MDEVRVKSEACERMKQEERKALGDELPQPGKLADSIEYQQGSVVSRTIIDKKAGTVTLFAFDKDEGLSEHTAPYEALVYVVEGEVEVKVAASSFVLEAGDMVILPANRPHTLRGIQRFKMLLVMVRS
jgi:quercetin dioxygenase-like cupin family protein